MKAKKENKTAMYGGLELDVIASNHELIPSTAKEIILSDNDKKGLAVAVKENLSCLLVGETGTGKTSAVKYLAYLTKRPYVRVNMTGYTTPDDLIGSKSIQDGNTYYENGIITHAMKIGAILVLDEINATPPDCAFILHGLLDDDRRITLPNGNIIRPHRDFRVFATCNPDYEGTRSMNRAFIDRFHVILQIDTLESTEEIKLLTASGIDDELSKKLVTVAEYARIAYKEEKTLTYVSTRALLQIAFLVSKGFEPKLAYQLAVIRKAHKSEQEAFSDFYNAVFKVSEDTNPKDDKTPIIITKGELITLKDENEDLKKRLKTIEGAMVATNENKDGKNVLLDDYHNKDIVVTSIAISMKGKSKGRLEKMSKDKLIAALINLKKLSAKYDDTKLCKKGNFAIAKANNGYSTTNNGWIGKILSVCKKDGTIDVQAINSQATGNVKIDGFIFRESI